MGGTHKIKKILKIGKLLYEVGLQNICVHFPGMIPRTGAMKQKPIYLTITNLRQIANWKYAVIYSKRIIFQDPHRDKQIFIYQNCEHIFQWF